MRKGKIIAMLGISMLAVSLLATGCGESHGNDTNESKKVSDDLSKDKGSDDNPLRNVKKGAGRELLNIHFDDTVDIELSTWINEHLTSDNTNDDNIQKLCKVSLPSELVLKHFENTHSGDEKYDGITPNDKSYTLKRYVADYKDQLFTETIVLEDPNEIKRNNSYLAWWEIGAVDEAYQPSSIINTIRGLDEAWDRGESIISERDHCISSITYNKTLDIVDYMAFIQGPDCVVNVHIQAHYQEGIDYQTIFDDFFQRL